MSQYGNRSPYGRDNHDYERPRPKPKRNGWRLAVAGALVYGALAYSDVLPSPAEIVHNNPKIAKTLEAITNIWKQEERKVEPPKINAAVTVKSKIEKALESKPQLRVGQESYSAEVKFAKNPGVLDKLAYGYCVSKVPNGEVCKRVTEYLLADNITYSAYGTVSPCINLNPDTVTIRTKNDPDKSNARIVELEVDSATNCNPNDKVDLDTNLGKWTTEKGIVQKFLGVFGYDPLKMDITQSTAAMKVAEDEVYLRACKENVFGRATEMGQEQLTSLTNGVLGQAMEEIRDENPDAKVIGVSKVEVKMRGYSDNSPCGVQTSSKSIATSTPSK